MIAIESFRRYTWRDALTVLSIGIVGCAMQFASIHAGQWAYYVNLLLFGTLLSGGALLIRKAGSPTFIGFAYGIGASALNAGVWWTTLLPFIIAGLLFEIFFLTLKLELKLIPLDIVIGTALGVASIPFTTVLLLAQQFAAQHAMQVLNLSLIGFCIGLMAAILAFLLWHEVEHSKAVLKYEYGFS